MQKIEPEKGSRDHNIIKSKETYSHFQPGRNSYVAIMHRSVTVSSKMHSNACANKSIL